MRVHEELSSTSDLVAQLAEAGEPDGAAVLARRQTAGRGTQGRAWDSRVGNLHLSILLRPSGSLRDAPQWALLAAVALADAVAPLLPDPASLRLKWPNDLLLNGAKMAGILAEATADQRGGIAWLSLGIGVNLAHAPQVPGRATACLADLGGPVPAPEAFAGDLLAALDHWRDRQQAEGFAAIRAAWLARGPAPDAELVVRRGADVITGRFAGLAEDGGLLLTSDGRLRAIVSGEVA
nr:biotin--[acetyl-CoA-carboxylase] ligase [Neoroseomonas eburnea]